MKLQPLIAAAIVCMPCMSSHAGPAFHSWQEKPALGWNSWDIFGTTVTEKQTREQADAMAEHLLPSGYDILRFHLPTLRLVGGGFREGG